jgi:uncharacterized membrane protein
MPPQPNQVPPAAPVPPVAPQPAGQSNNTLMAILSYLGILIIVPFLTDAKNDPFVKFHIKQGLVLIISWVVGMFIGVIPVLGWILAPLFTIFNVVCLIIGIINASSGKQKELPLIGTIAKNFNF